MQPSPALITILAAIKEDKALSNWLKRLPTLNSAERTIEIASMIKRMRASNEGEDLISAIESLSDEHIAWAAARSIE